MRLSLALAPRLLLPKAAMFGVRREADGIADLGRATAVRGAAGATDRSVPVAGLPFGGSAAFSTFSEAGAVIGQANGAASSLCAEIEVDLAQRVRESGEW